MTDESLFSAALALPPAARPGFLAARCPDAALRKQVEDLLAAADASNPLDRPPPDLDRTNPRADSASVTSTAAVGDRVSPYKLLEKIGEGGMGEVWVADQTEPIKRRVALKLIKPGMDSRSVLGRFEAERQALAVMDHPNIARVLDAGTTPDGRPYFVMELVKGTPITEFADARRLTPKQRLELFVPVCQAIQHAHMKGIIHRDIKPSNVLVALHDETPVPKVIDFGVAKAVGQQLTDKTIYTGFGALVGTPAYMAPEQAAFNQLDVDTRADVYALGVLLYELLAGSPPIERERLKRAALDEVLRIVREEEPPRPSQRLSTADTRASIAAVRGTEPAKLSALLKGELDWIVMKALEKDRTRRYDTATALAKDVQRYINGDAVEACPPTLGYRLRKAYRRNKPAVWVAAAFLLLTYSGASGIYFAYQRAVQAEQRATDDRDAADTERANALAAQAQAQAERNAALAARDTARRTYYAAQMNLAAAASKAEDGARCLTLLDEFRPAPGEPDLRGPEWHYLYRRWNTADEIVRIPELAIGMARLSRDASRLLVFPKTPPSGDHPPKIVHTIDVYDTATGRRLRRLEVPDQPNPNAGPLAGMNTFVTAGATECSDDGGIVVHRGWEAITVLETATGRVRYRLPREEQNDTLWQIAALSGDGRRLVVESGGKARVYAGVQASVSEKIIDLTTGKTVRDRAGEFATIALSRDGTRMVLADGQDNLLVEDTDTGKEVARITTRGTGYARGEEFGSIAGRRLASTLTPDNEKLVYSQSSSQVGAAVFVWDLATGRRLDSDTNRRWVSSLIADGSTMLAVREHVVEVVKTRTGSVLHSFRLPESVTGRWPGEVAFDASGNRVAAVSAGTVRFWDLKPPAADAAVGQVDGDGTLLTEHLVATAPTADRFVDLYGEPESPHRALRLHHPRYGQVTNTLQLTEEQSKGLALYGGGNGVFDAGNRRVLFRTVNGDGAGPRVVQLWVWELGENRLRWLGTYAGRVFSFGTGASEELFALRPQGDVVATVGVDLGRSVRDGVRALRLLFLSTATGKLVRETNLGDKTCERLTFAADGRTVAACYTITRQGERGERLSASYGHATIDVETGRILTDVTFPEENASKLGDAQGGRAVLLTRPPRPSPPKLPPDDPNRPPPWAGGRGSFDPALMGPATGCVVYDTGTGRELYRLSRPGMAVRQAALTPDGRRLAVSFTENRQNIVRPGDETEGKPCVAVYSMTDGRLLYEVPIAGRGVLRLSLSAWWTHDGRRLLVSQSNPFSSFTAVWEVRDGESGRVLIEIDVPGGGQPGSPSVRSSADGNRWVFETGRRPRAAPHVIECGPLPEPTK